MVKNGSYECAFIVTAGLVTLLCNPIKPILIERHSFNIIMTKELQQLDD